MSNIEIIPPEDEQGGTVPTDARCDDPLFYSLGGYDDYRKTLIPQYGGGMPQFEYKEYCLEINRPDGDDAPEHEVAYNYFLWLCSQVLLDGTNGEHYKYITPPYEEYTYFNLARKLHQAPYKVLTTLDDNSMSDVKMLRYWYANRHSNYKDYSGIAKPGASLLEVLIALVQRFDTDVMMNPDGEDRSARWFWLIMNNTALDIFNDSYFSPTMNDDGRYEYDTTGDKICSGIIENIINRTYEFSGEGGCFPLKNPKSDQRKVDLWHQMHAFFVENEIE